MSFASPTAIDLDPYHPVVLTDHLLFILLCASFFSINCPKHILHSLKTISPQFNVNHQFPNLTIPPVGSLLPIAQYQYLFIMASVAFASERDCETNNTELQHLKRKVNCLQSETDLLTRIIQLNQATLEEINELVVTQLKKNERQSISELVIQLNSQEGQIGKGYGQSQTIFQQISKRIDDAAQSIYRDFNKGYQNLMIEHYDELNQLKKALKLESIRKIKENQQDCDTSIEEYTSGRAIFEIPIEMQVLKEVTDTDVQVDLFSSSRSLIYEVPVEIHQIFEIPVELKQIYQVPIQLNTEHFIERNRIYEIPVEIEQVYEVELRGQNEAEKVIFENVVVNEKQFLKYEEEINLLKKEIERLSSQLTLLKVEGSQKMIYQIPVEMDYLGSEDLNKSQCHVDMPAEIEIESQPNLDNPAKYNSLKQGSKVSTQFGTRPDLDIESPHRANIDQKHSLLVSTPGAIQQVESLAQANSKLRESFSNASSIRNFNLLIGQNMNCEVLPDQRQPQIIFEGGVDMQVYGELVEIEMHIMEDVEKSDQQTQTDFIKERILKIPQIQIVEVPYEIERAVERIAKIPALQIVEIPTVADQVAANSQEMFESKEVKLYSRRNPYEQELISEQQPVLFSSHPNKLSSPTPRVIVKQVPTQIIIERQLPVKVITKQVPIQVIIEKEVIVQKVVIREIPVEIIEEKEIIVERFIELPQKYIVKEVPYEVIIEKEVIVERVVELPVRTIIKQVPVEVFIEKIVYVPSPPIIKEIPIEVIVEKEVEVIVNQIATLPQKTIIKQVPYEVILQAEKIVEVPKIIVKQVPIEVIIEQPSKTIIKEVPVEVIVEKIVHIYHEIPVQIIFELIVEKPVIIQKIVEVPVIVECPVEIITQKRVPVIKEIPYEVAIVQEVQKIVIKEIPVEVEVEVVKIVKEIVEVPVLIFMNAEKPKEEFKGFDLSDLAEQPESPGKLHSYDAQNLDEPFSNMKLLLQSNDPRVKSQPEHLHHIVEMPVEIIVQKDVEKIKEVIKIKQVPTELILVEEKETIMYVPVQKIVYVKQIVQIPVEVEVEKIVVVTKIVEIPIEVEVVVYRDRIMEVPVEVLIEKSVYKIKEIPIELMMQEEYSQETPIQEVIVEQQVFPNSRVRLESIEEFPSANILNNNNVEQDGHFEEVYEVPMGINYFNGDVVYQIDATNIRRGSGSFEEFIIHLPQSNIEVDESSAQTDHLQEPIEVKEKKDAKERIKIVEIPIQVENINYQQVQKEVQLKYREILADLKHRYEQEISELHLIMANLQSIILQSNEEKLFLQEKLETNALNEQSLLKELQLAGKEASAEIEKLMKQIQEVTDAKTQEVDELQREVERLSRLKLNKVATEPPRGKIWELPIEVLLEHETNQLAIQTEDINLGSFEVLEIPIQLQATPLTVQEVLIPEEQPTEQVNLHAQRQFSIFQLVDSGCQVDTIQKMIFELPVEMQTENEAVSVEIQTEFTVAQDQEIVLFRYTDCNPYDLENAEKIQLYEVPSEDAKEHPVIYEIATEIEIVKECIDSHVQTEPAIPEKLVYEVPVEVQAIEVISLSSQGSLSEEEEEEEKEQALEQQQQEKFVITGRSSNGFKGAWKASTLKSDDKGSTFKKKPNSEYFTSRIVEIPVEIAISKENINMEIQTHEEKVLKSIEVQTETSQIDIRERLLEDAGFSRTVLSRQREITLAHMKIVEAFEPVRVSAATPKKSQKQIARLGSQNQALNIYHTFSNAQSITPNQFDASASYDKFPVPNINIHNISLIKKSSLHSQNKFFGSLDIREELLSQDEALASVRFESKKLTGFEQEQSSQEGDIQGGSREMIIEENETIVSRDRDINCIQTPNLEPHDLNFSEYATLKEKLYEPEEEKVSHQELYEAAQTELDNIRRRLEKKTEEVAELKVDFDRQTCKYQEEIRKLNEEMNYLHKENRQQAISGEAARTRVAQLEEGKVKLQKQVEMLFDNWERLREEHLKSESSSTKEIQRLRNIISEKIAEIKELKSDQHHQKEIFQTQLNEYRDLVDKKSEVIDGLEEELQRRGDRIEQLIQGLEEMRKNITNHNNQVDTAAIYEQEFQRVKEGFQEEKRQLNYQIYELKQAIQQLKDSIKEETRKNEELQANVVDLERAVEEARHQYSSLHHLKSELENNYMQGVKCLNQELEEMKYLVKEKDEIIQHRIGSSIEPPSSKMRIEYLSKQASQISPQDRNNKSLEAYSRKLQQLLRKYQRVIVENQGTIEQLQEKVYEYLKDALEKEQQAQGLYMKLVDYENTINNILVEKVTLDIENKRLSKQIELSEKKLNALGNRLIEVARKRAQYDSDDEYYE